jgi:hypothetical protein
MSYQAVVRDGSNTLVTSTIVGMQISILQGSVSGADDAYSIIQSDDGGFVFTGTTKSFGTFGDCNIWLVKTDVNGSVSSDETEKDDLLFYIPTLLIALLHLP